GGGAVAHALEAQQQASAVDPAGLDGQRPGRGRVGGQDGAGAEAELRLVGADLDGDLALDAVGAADACDYQLHGACSPVGTTSGRGRPGGPPRPEPVAM